LFTRHKTGEQMSATGSLKIVRKANLAACARRLDVLVDGKKIGNVGNGKEEYFELSPGKHIVQVKLLAKSEPLDMDFPADSSVELECGISPRFWPRTLAIFAMVLLWQFGKHFVPGLVASIVIVLLIVWAIVASFRAGGTYYLKRVNRIQAGR